MGLFGIMCLVTWIDNIDKSWETVKGVSLLICIVVPVLLLIASFGTYQTVNGSLAGEIEFSSDAITINGKVFGLKSINDLDFDFEDYLGQLSQNKEAFNPRLLQGVNNYVTFTDNTRQTQTIYFKLETEHHYQDLAPFINQAIKLKKMDFKRGIDLVGIENLSI